MPRPSTRPAGRAAAGARALAAFLAVAPAALAVPQRDADQVPAATATSPGGGSIREAAARIREYERETTDENKAQARAALASVDAEVEELEQLAEATADEAERRRLETRLERLKKQRDGLRAGYNHARIDELRHDASGEWERFKRWITGRSGEADDEVIGSSTSREEEPIGSSSRDPDSAAARPQAYSGEETTEQKYQKLALARIGHELEFLEQLAVRLQDADREVSQARVEALQERRNVLAQEFSQNRYQSLMQDIDREIDRAIALAE